MRKILFILTLVLLTKLGVNAQERPCTLTTLDGNTIEGFVRNKGWIFDNNFRFYDSKGNFQKIKAKVYAGMVLDTVQYKVFENKNGKPRFMKELISEGKAHLYTHKYEIMVELSRYTIWDYYIVKKDNVYYMESQKMKHHPERYFGGAEELTEEIRNTKRKYQKEKIFEWVQRYNKVMSNSN